MNEFDITLVSEKLEFMEVDLTTTVADVFDTDVPEDKQRNIVAIIASADGTNACTVTVNKVSEADVASPFLKAVALAATATKEVPGVYDPLKPILVLEGGCNLSAVCSAGTPTLTVIYWDR